MITYTFLQQYWWFLISLLGGLLVFLLFVQGANSLIFRLGRDETERSLIVNSTGRLPPVLQHQLRRCLLGVDAHPRHVHLPGRQL